MPKLSTFFESKYLKKEDAEKPLLLTIRAFAEEDLAMQGQPPEVKLIMYFTESKKGLVVNSTNKELLQIATGEDTTEGLIGKKIVVFVDPTVPMGGKLVGGLRIRAPRNQAPPVQQQTEPEPLPTEQDDSQDVPF